MFISQESEEEATVNKNTKKISIPILLTVFCLQSAIPVSAETATIETESQISAEESEELDRLMEDLQKGDTRSLKDIIQNSEIKLDIEKSENDNTLQDNIKNTAKEGLSGAGKIISGISTGSWINLAAVVILAVILKIYRYFKNRNTVS